MKKKNKTKIGLVIGIGVFVIIAVSTVLFILFGEDKKTSLTILEKRWIEDNKNKIIDLGITYDVPMYTLSGEGVIFDFISDLEKNTGLEFYKIPYELSTEIKHEYYFANVEELPDSDYILIDSTPYVVISKISNNTLNYSDKKYGVLKGKIDSVKYYLNDSIDVKEYTSASTMVSDYNKGDIDYIVLPYETYLQSILELKESHIVEYINDMQQYYILMLSKNNKKLNSIIKKYYEKWSKSNKDKLYNKLLLDLYYKSKGVDQQKANSLNAKSYVYGYVENLPYEGIINNKLYGISGEYLSKFANITGVEFEYVSYKSVKDLKEALNNKKIDVAFGYYDFNSKNVNNTISIGSTNLVVVAHNDNDLIVKNLKSLKGKEVSIIKDTGIRNYILEKTQATLKEFNTLKNLLESRGKNSIIIVDEKTYDYYRNTVLSDYQIVYRENIDVNYSFQVSKKDENELFLDLFNYFLSFTDNNYQKRGYTTLVREKSLYKNSEKKYLIYALLLIVVLLVVILKILKIGKKNKQNKREEKIRYIDMLTSLKNRNYLNTHMNEWNENKVYPQAIVIIDLNNIKYINDNYGYEEGDNVIGMASNILINTQLENTDIIRTDGNEFLVYMVGYDDKKVIAYIRKLYKELQQLPHEFGAALGYSMIEDDIKSIDDAINEATLDMRENKQNLE